MGSVPEAATQGCGGTFAGPDKVLCKRPISASPQQLIVWGEEQRLGSLRVAFSFLFRLRFVGQDFRWSLMD